MFALRSLVTLQNITSVTLTDVFFTGILIIYGFHAEKVRGVSIIINLTRAVNNGRCVQAMPLSKFFQTAMTMENRMLKSSICK